MPGPECRHENGVTCRLSRRAAAANPAGAPESAVDPLCLVIRAASSNALCLARRPSNTVLFVTHASLHDAVTWRHRIALLLCLLHAPAAKPHCAVASARSNQEHL